MIRATLFTLFWAFSIISGQYIEYEDGLEFVQVNERFYVSTEERSFYGAWIGCKTGGMKLASVESEDAQIEINNATMESEYSHVEGYWIGAVSETYSTDSWYWVDSGLRMIYDNWGTSQPRYNYYEGSFCVRVGNFYKVNEVYTWQNVGCSNYLYYICELSS